MEQIIGFEGLYEIHLVGTPDGRPGVWSVRNGRYLKPGLADGYLTVVLCQVDGKRRTYRIHRLVAEHFITGNGCVDHIDRNRTNNVVTNLRWVTYSENEQNKSHKGYSWHKCTKKWKVAIGINGKTIYGGLFATEEEARAKYLELKATHHPAYVHLATEGQ